MEEKMLDGQSYDNVHERIEQLKAMFPEAVSEGRLDYDMFMALLGDEFDNDNEKYQFTWKGKLDALKLAQKRSGGTLRPDFDDSRDWDTTGNLYIEGDNLEVLKLLQQGYLRKVKTIYIDPPYNTGNDFVYEDDFADPIKKYKEATGQGMRANPETAGRYHSNWLNMMYPRLKIAKSLLRDDGAIFMSVDDNEVHNLRKLCDEVFGEDNFIGQMTVINNLKGRNDKKNIATCHEYMLIYGKMDFEAFGLPLTEEQKAAFDKIDDNGNYYQLRDLRRRGQADRREDRPKMYFPIYYNKTTNECSLVPQDGSIEIVPLRGDGSDGRWRWGMERVESNLKILEPKYNKAADKWGVEYRIYLNPALNPVGEDEETDEDNERSSKTKSFWMGGEISTDVARRQIKELLGPPVFDFPKSVGLVKKPLYMSTQSTTHDIILDFFSGSATTAHAVMQLNAEDRGNRKFIMVQIPEPTDEKSEAYKAGYKSIADIGKERIRRAGDKIKAEWQEKNSQVSLEENSTAPPDIGFRVFKLDSSNLCKWDDAYVTPDQLDMLYQRMENSLEGFKDGRRAIDVVYEVFLKYGVPLTEKLSTLEIEGKTFYAVGENGYLFICLDAGITVEIVEQAAQYAPGTIIFADECFENDDELTNAALVLEKAKIEFRWI